MLPKRLKVVKIMNKYWAHFKTITKHKWEVGKVCFKIGLYWQGICHDLSKYSPTEFMSSARHFQGNRSPIDAEKEDIGYSIAWQHHKGHNPHHWEYWIDNIEPKEVEQLGTFIPNSKINDDIHNSNSWYGKQTFKSYNYVSQPTAIKIPYKYVLEMICDWIGAGKVYNKEKWTQEEPLNYYLKCKPKRIFHPETQALIEYFLNIIKDKGIEGFVNVVKNPTYEITDYLGEYRP